MKRKIVAALLCTAMAASMITGCGNGEKKDDAPKLETKDTTDDAEPADDGQDDSQDDGRITVGFSQVGAESDWRTANTQSMKETFSEENGYDLIFDDAQQKQENQITAVRNFIQQDVDYILLAPVTETGWDTLLQEAKDADIPVIIVDRMVDVSDDSLYTAWVGTNPVTEGRKASEWLNAYAEAKGIKELNIAHIQGTIGSTAQIGRTQGLEEAAKEYGWNIVAQQTGEFTQAKGQEVMESMLKQYDNINVVYCENDNEAFGAVDAIEAAGKKVGADGDILVLSFDATGAGLQDVIDDRIICDVECNPLHGPRVKELIDKLEAGEEIDKENYVDGEIFAFGSDVKSVTVDGTDYEVTEMTDEVLSKRAY